MATSLLLRYQGSVVGGVVGDCVGAVFEGLWGAFIGLDKVLKLVNKIQAGNPFIMFLSNINHF